MFNIESLYARQPEAIIASLRSEALSQLREEASALVAFVRVAALAAEVETAIPDAERDAAQAEKQREEATAALAGAKETLQQARGALDADAAKTREAWEAVRPPMMAGGVPNASTQMQSSGPNPDYRPQSRERASLELAAEDAQGAVQRARRELAFAESQERRMTKRLKMLRRHAQVYAELETPKTPTLALLLNSE